MIKKSLRENSADVINHLCVVLFLCGFLFGSSTVPSSSPAKLELANHRIEQVQIQGPNLPAELEWKEYQNFLVFPNSNIRIPLARSDIDQNGPQMGFDPATLKLQWLQPNELLWISWTTVFQGTGGYTHDGNVILEVDGGENRELFRDYFESFAHGGWMLEYFSTLEIAYNDHSKTFRFTRSTAEINGDMGAPDAKHSYPFSAIFTNDDGKIGYLSKVNTVDTWTYKLSENKLKFLRGNSAVDLGDEATAIEDIVTGFHVTRAKLQRMNPRLRLQQKATGLVTLSENVEPYEVGTDDGLNGDK